MGQINKLKKTTFIFSLTVKLIKLLLKDKHTWQYQDIIIFEKKFRLNNTYKQHGKIYGPHLFKDTFKLGLKDIAHEYIIQGLLQLF